MSTPKSVSLYYRAGTSDKVYNVQLWPDGGGWQVFFQYGRRGSSLNEGAKLSSPTGYASAERAYDELVASKTKKGYSPGVLSGKSAASAPSVAPVRLVATPPPVWDGFELVYAQTATDLGLVSSLSKNPDPAVLLLSWLSLDLQEGLPDACRLASRLSAQKSLQEQWPALAPHLDEAPAQWLLDLEPSVQTRLLQDVRTLSARLAVAA